MAETQYTLGPLSKTVLALLTLRMNAAGLLDLDEPVAKTLPHLLEGNPFRVAITARHLLTETAGFAYPPHALTETARLDPYTTQVRTAGQMAHDDPIGWQILAAFLAAKGGDALSALADEYLLHPLGLQDEDLITESLPYRGSGRLIAALARLYVLNRDKDRNLFLPPEIYEQLNARHNWRMHPIGPRRTLGGEMKLLGNRTYISAPVSTLTPQHPAYPNFLAFPDQGIAFVSLSGRSADYMSALAAVADTNFLPTKPDHRLQEARGLVEPIEPFSGRYVRSDKPSAWLQDRLQSLRYETLYVRQRGDTLLIERPGLVTTMQKAAPYYFTAANGQEAVFSPYRQGGYLVLDGRVYRYVGALGNPTFVITAFPYVVILLLSGAFYMRSPVSKRWRRMGAFCTLSSLLILLGCGADWALWPTVVFEWDMPWLANLWRIALNAGLALALSIPMFAISFTRKNELPEGAAILIAPLHLALLSFASLALFLILVAWGLAGEFSAY